MLLNDLRVIEGSSFVAAPSCGLHLAQLGAEVIRFDTIGGGPDFRRWPRSEAGASFFWEGLNKGKKSIALDLRAQEGRELAAALITAPGSGAGLFVTNFPAAGFLAHDRLAARRPDLLTVRIMGRADGSPGVDYTVNAALGLPFMTGPAETPKRPVNHVLPAWDLLAGAHAALALLAAERHRLRTGVGQEILLPLHDLAAATLGTLGQIAEVTAAGRDRSAHGNALFGAFGRDFRTADSRLVMIVAITARQWSGLVSALDLAQSITALEAELCISFAQDEGLRFVHRDRLFPLVEAVVAGMSLPVLAARLDRDGVCWSPYRTLAEALAEDPDLSFANPLWSEVRHPGGHAYPTPGPAAAFGAFPREAAGRAPRLGEHTDEILASILGLPDHAIAGLHDRGVVAASA
ncbi:carnitine dehydratase [Prosthecomicrobium hirschii]|uniref:CoA transferase n=1 Tax=Prosthecodimorpha hirschii TaxID=665126 RepID=UPI001127C58D|nr:CoA transferase [Prosthecomicrobium hirschii]TPQ49309.1 carnitine dehydratase [Prosthecomicrobium hirschii]